MMNRICLHHRSIQPIRWPICSESFRYFGSSSSLCNDTSSELKHGNNLSRLFTLDQKSLLRQAHQIAAQSRSLARQVGNVTIREDSLLTEILRLRNRHIERKLKDTACDRCQDETDAATPGNVVAEDDLPPSLFTVVFAGEFNSGKSTLINALLGKELLESGVLPTTDSITVLMGDENIDGIGETINSFEGSLDTTTTSLPAQLHLLPTSQYPLLSDLCVIDTPGTNAIMSLQHTASTLRILHNADLLIFVTSADRPFSESEKELLITSITYRKRVLVVINKMDILERQKGEDHGDASKKRVISYVTEHASELLGGIPVVIPVSGRDALSVKVLSGNKDEDGIWKRCNFGTLEHYLLDTLTASSKVKTKLLNPIGVAEGMLLDCQKELKQRVDDLEVDVMTLRLLNSQTAAWEKELRSEVMDQCRQDVKAFFVRRCKVVDAVLDQLSIIDQFKIGFGLGRTTFHAVWEDSIARSQSMVFDRQLKSGNALSSENGVKRSLLAIVAQYAESITTRSKNQGEVSIEYLGKRPSAICVSKGENSIHNIVGLSRISAPKFDRLQEDLSQSFRNAIQNTTTRLPSDDECAAGVYSQLHTTSLLSGTLCMGAAVGPLTMIAGYLDSASAIALSSTLFLFSGLSIPLGNRYISRLYRQKWMSHADKLDASLDVLFTEVMKRVSMQLCESVAPYSRFVNGEGESLSELQTKVESTISRANALRGNINKACD